MGFSFHPKMPNCWMQPKPFLVATNWWWKILVTSDWIAKKGMQYVLGKLSVTNTFSNWKQLTIWLPTKKTIIISDRKWFWSPNFLSLKLASKHFRLPNWQLNYFGQCPKKIWHQEKENFDCLIKRGSISIVDQDPKRKLSTQKHLGKKKFNHSINNWDQTILD
jgi:hypothetical protein